MTFRPHFVLVHSPSVGPMTWQPVADALRPEHVATVADLRGVAAAGPDFASFVAGRVVEAVRADEAASPLVVVVHSNAGHFAPTIAAALERSSYDVAGLLFVDAAIPPVEGPAADLAGEFAAKLREMAVDGVLPRWSDWWPPEAMEEHIPDPVLREAVLAEQPRLPLSFYEQRLEPPSGWADRAGGYLWFCESYDEELARAEALGWPVRRVPGEHLHMLVDPAAVARAVVELAEELSVRQGG